MAVFVTRNLGALDLAHTFAQVGQLGRSGGAALTIIPCDEFGVCPEYRAAATSVRGQPAHFMGIRLWLRRKLVDAYGCRVVDVGEDRALDTAFAALAVAEGQLRVAEGMLREVERALADLPDREERLRGARAIAENIQVSYETALFEYHHAWLASRRLSSRETLDVADSSPPNPTV